MAKHAIDPPPQELVIESPQKNDVVLVAAPSANQPSSLVVYGQDVLNVTVNGKQTPNQITAALSVNNSAPQQGIPLKQPRHWAVVFSLASVDTTNPYTVTVTNSQGKQQSVTFKLAIQAAHKPDQADGISRFDPASGSSVSGSGFYVTGNSAANTSTYAFMNQAGGWMYMGNIIQTPPNYIFYFQNVPAGIEYTITVVSWSNPPHYYYSYDITVT